MIKASINAQSFHKDNANQVHNFQACLKKLS